MPRLLSRLVVVLFVFGLFGGISGANYWLYCRDGTDTSGAVIPTCYGDSNERGDGDGADGDHG